jgi:hypothetical protein
MVPSLHHEKLTTERMLEFQNRFRELQPVLLGTLLDIPCVNPPVNAARHQQTGIR